MGPWGSWGLDFTIPGFQIPSWGDFSAGLGHLHPIHSASGNLSNQWMNLPSVSSLTTIIYRKKIGQKWWNDFNEILIKWAIMFSPEIILFHRAISGPTLSQPHCETLSFHQFHTQPQGIHYPSLEHQAGTRPWSTNSRVNLSRSLKPRSLITPTLCSQWKEKVVA